MAPGNPPAYEKNEKALCFHHELLYEAKILEDPQREDEKDKSSSWRYRVHYKGWKNTWDDWVPQERLRKLTEDNRELAASLRRDVMQNEGRQRGSKSTASSKKVRAQGSEIGSGRGSEERHSSVPAGGRSTKRGRDNEIEKVDTLVSSRRNSRMRFTGSSQLNLPDASEFFVPASGQDHEIEDKISRPADNARNSSFVASKSSKGGVFSLQDAPKGKTTSDQGIKTIASRTIHGKYDDAQEFIPGSSEVVSRRGHFKAGVFSCPDLEAATAVRLRSGPRPTTRSGKSEQQKQSERSIPRPDQDTSTDDDIFAFVLDVLSRPPPPDEAEHMTVETFKRGQHWAPLIGGTSENERTQIEDEARQKGLWASSKADIHPQYGRARANDPLNANRLHYFEGQDLKRKLMVAGVPKDPISVDPPGSGTPFDALRYPDRLVKLPPEMIGGLSISDLQQLDHETIMRFPKSALKMMSPKLLSKLRISLPLENDSNDDDSQEEAFFARPSVHFTVPDMIKGYLVDDWENVTKSLTLVELPSKAPVNWILDTYFHEEKGKRRLGSADANRLVEIVEGMKTYFEKMLGKTLLYKFEREQYAEVRKLWEAGSDEWEGKGPGDCYGAEHLCRLIVSMPEWIAQTNMDGQSVAKIKEEMALLNHWICRNHQRLFVNQYERPSAEYIENARD